MLMKVVSALRVFAGLAGLVVLGTAPAYAQFEVDPDHFESPNVQPFDKPNNNSAAASIHYDGKFKLPYTVQCNGRSLRPGKYSVSLRSDGKVGQAILNQKGQAIGIAGLIHNQTHKPGNAALIVEHNGKTRRLSVIQVAELDLVFDPELQMKNASNNKPRRIEKLPLLLFHSQN